MVSNRTARLADHLYAGIGRIKLGRALAGEKRYAEAEEHVLGRLQHPHQANEPIGDLASVGPERVGDHLRRARPAGQSRPIPRSSSTTIAAPSSKARRTPQPRATDAIV